LPSLGKMATRGVEGLAATVSRPPGENLSMLGEKIKEAAGTAMDVGTLATTPEGREALKGVAGQIPGMMRSEFRTNPASFLLEALIEKGAAPLLSTAMASPDFLRGVIKHLKKVTENVKQQGVREAIETGSKELKKKASKIHKGLAPASLIREAAESEGEMLARTLQKDGIKVYEDRIKRRTQEIEGLSKATPQGPVGRIEQELAGPAPLKTAQALVKEGEPLQDVSYYRFPFVTTEGYERFMPPGKTDVQIPHGIMEDAMAVVYDTYKQRLGRNPTGDELADALKPMLAAEGIGLNAQAERMLRHVNTDEMIAITEEGIRRWPESFQWYDQLIDWLKDPVEGIGKHNLPEFDAAFAILSPQKAAKVNPRDAFEAMRVARDYFASLPSPAQYNREEFRDLFLDTFLRSRGSKKWKGVPVVGETENVSMMTQREIADKLAAFYEDGMMRGDLKTKTFTLNSFLGGSHFPGTTNDVMMASWYGEPPRHVMEEFAEKTRIHAAKKQRTADVSKLMSEKTKVKDIADILNEGVTDKETRKANRAYASAMSKRIAEPGLKKPGEIKKILSKPTAEEKKTLSKEALGALFPSPPNKPAPSFTGSGASIGGVSPETGLRVQTKIEMDQSYRVAQYMTGRVAKDISEKHGVALAPGETQAFFWALDKTYGPRSATGGSVGSGSGEIREMKEWAQESLAALKQHDLSKPFVEFRDLSSGPSPEGLAGAKPYPFTIDPRGVSGQPSYPVNEALMKAYQEQQRKLQAGRPGFENLEEMVKRVKSPPQLPKQFEFLRTLGRGLQQ